MSVVTPTLRRPQEVSELLANLGQQQHLPYEVILVDGAPPEETATEAVAAAAAGLTFRVSYIRHGGGTALQRNVGIDAATGDYIAFVDDDIRLKPDFFELMLKTFREDSEKRVGGIAGYITNQFLDPEESPRWRWYRRLRLFTTYEPGRYDYQTGYPINRYMQPLHNGLRGLDFMGAGCAVWRREVLDSGLRFSEFFSGYGILEDAHFALRARRKWKLLEHGDARCVHLKAAISRENAREIAGKTAVNYRYVFVDIVPNRTWRQEFRFWRVQLFDLFRVFVHAGRHRTRNDWLTVLGKIQGIVAAVRIRPTGSCDMERQG